MLKCKALFPVSNNGTGQGIWLEERFKLFMVLPNPGTAEPHPSVTAQARDKRSE